MKKLSIFIIIVLVALASCTKSKEVHPEIGDGNDEIVTVGMKDVHVKYTRTDHAELQKVIFHYSLAEVQQFVSAEMTRRDTFFELTLDDLLCDALYSYYYELFYNGGETSTTERKTFRTQACDTPTPPTPPSGEHEYVDLGLPSGLLWATCNVGANAPEEYCDYFAWGETQPKDVYDWSTYQYCNGSINTLTKYCNRPDCGNNGFTDDLTTLLPEDDAATVNWGGDWRMPTYDEWRELYQNTTHTWTTQNGVNGRLFTASNGNSLFLPAAGYYEGSSLNLVGCDGNYQPTSFKPNDPNCAYRFDFGSDSGHCYIYYGVRSRGNSVRAVRSEVTPPTPPGGVPEGAINGLFTINANGDQVYFSQGNLQYRASSNTWRFAEHQWNYVGETLIDFDGGTIQMGNVYENGVKCDNKLISSTYSGWIDLFGWGTSGWECGNTYFYPWDNTNSVSGYGPTVPSNLSGIYANCDWGMYNAISNGGNQIKLWRTMTREEWNYVFFLRSTLSGKHYAKAQIDDVYGVILLPDNWSNSVYNLIGADDNTGSIGYRHNIMTSSVWENIFQPNGAVFLPAAGERGEFPARNSGCYWSASYYDDDCMWAWHAVFEDEYVFINDDGFGHFRHAGHSVRLVHDAQ